MLTVTISPSVVPPNTTGEQTFTVQGLQLGDFCEVNKPTTQTGLGIVNSRVSSANTLAIAFVNATGATITPTANETYYCAVSRPENLSSTNNSTLIQIT